MPTIDLPINPSTSDGEVGKDFILKINTGTASVPVWTPVGGQRGTSFKQTADEVDVTSKMSGGWKTTKPGLRSWSMDLDGLVVLNDTGAKAMEQAFDENKPVNLQLCYPDGTARTGWGALTDYSIDTPHDGEATLKGTVSGQGAISARAAVE
jgi:TP901-1 family phage major tail protein